MSRSTLERVLELLINEEKEAADALLHDFIIENARRIHEELLSESDEQIDDDLDGLGDEDSDIDNDSAEIDSEEFYDNEASDEEELDDLALDDEPMDDEGSADIEGRLDDVEQMIADLEAEFDSIMNGDDSDVADSDEDLGDEYTDDDLSDVESENDDEYDFGGDDEEDETKIVEYVTPVSAKVGDNGVQTKSPVNANPKRPGDDSKAAPIRTKDGNTSGGKGPAPQTIKTNNVNVSGNGKAPAFKPQTAKPGDNGIGKKSLL